MVVGHLFIGLLAGLTAAVLALFAGLSPWLALALYSLSGAAGILLAAVLPVLRPAAVVSEHTLARPGQPRG